MTMTKWLAQVCGDVEPILHGPYKTDAARLKAAQQLRREDEGTLFRLDIRDDQTPFVYAFSELEVQ